MVSFLQSVRIPQWMDTMDIPVNITLNETEQRLAKYLASQWTKYDDQIGYPPTISGKPVLQNNIDAIGAEIAFCKAANIYPNLNLHGFEEWDCTLPGGTKVNVKQSPRKGSHLDLLVQIKKYKTYPDIYVLMIGTFPTYEYAGWIEKEKVIKPERINHRLPKPAYTYPRRHLKGVTA